MQRKYFSGDMWLEADWEERTKWNNPKPNPPTYIRRSYLWNQDYSGRAEVMDGEKEEQEKHGKMFQRLWFWHQNIRSQTRRLRCKVRGEAGREADRN